MSAGPFELHADTHGAGAHQRQPGTEEDNMGTMKITVDFGTNINWGEPVEDEHHERLVDAYEAQLEERIQAAYPDATVRVTRHRDRADSLVYHVSVDGEDRTERYVTALEIIGEKAFNEACRITPEVVS